MDGLAVYMNKGLAFSYDFFFFFFQNDVDSYLCFQLTLHQSVSYFFFPLITILFFVWNFRSVPLSTGKILLFNTSVNVFDFQYFNALHKDWLTYSGWTDTRCYISFLSPITLLRLVTFLLRFLTVTLIALNF